MYPKSLILTVWLVFLAAGAIGAFVAGLVVGLVVGAFAR